MCIRDSTVTVPKDGQAVNAPKARKGDKRMSLKVTTGKSEKVNPATPDAGLPELLSLIHIFAVLPEHQLYVASDTGLAVKPVAQRVGDVIDTHPCFQVLEVYLVVCHKPVVLHHADSGTRFLCPLHHRQFRSVGLACRHVQERRLVLHVRELEIGLGRLLGDVFQPQLHTIVGGADGVAARTGLYDGRVLEGYFLVRA